jgi:DNA mismatch repair protein mutL
MALVKLDDYTIEQIAAGEVIEAPVSVVKELVENSIDAKAKNIVVEIKNGGKTFIRVTDDGIGIAKNDMILAFEKHTTSKISNFNDLYYIYSLGFRGEALSSIANVSNLVAISKTKDEDIGKKLEFKNSKYKESFIATNTGTSIIVKDLFNNLPVRKKFLKSDIAETNAISKLIYSFAIGYNDISFKYIKNGRIDFISHSNEDLETKIPNLLDTNLKDKLIKISAKNDIYNVDGFISNPSYYRGSRSLQYLFINNRLVNSNLITNSTEKEYRSYIPNGRFPAFFLFINTNPKNLDVNVHPNKKTIKFNYEDDLIDLISTSIYKTLIKENNPSEISNKEIEKKQIPDLSNYQNLLDSYKSFNIVKEDTKSYENDDFFNEDKNIISNNQNFKDKDFTKIKSGQQKSLLEKKSSYLYLTSIFGKYSLFKKSENEIIILDHRRADEAIKYDAFIKNISNKDISSQILLKPIIINLKADDKDKFNDKKEFILDLGFDIDQIGESQIIIRSIPQIFDVPESDTFFYEILDIDFKNKNEIFYKNIGKFIRSNIFRKGHNINKDESISLLNDLFKLDNPYKTQDGKLTLLVLNKDSLENFFER